MKKNVLEVLEQTRGQFPERIAIEDKDAKLTYQVWK